MSLRAMALGLSLVVASVAQAGVNVRLAPRDPGPFPPSAPGLTDSVVRVDIFLSQDTAAPKLLRLIQFDFNATSPELALSTPFTASLNLPGGPSDDLRFWVFSSLAVCAGDSTMCGAGHLIDGTLDDTQPPGLKTTYAAFGTETELGTNPALQVELPADGSEVRIAEVEVIFPPGIADGTYTLDVTNTLAVSGDAGAQVHWGYGADIPPNNVPITRLKATTPSDVTGGTVDLVVGTGVPATVQSWVSMGPHTGFGDLPIDLPGADTGVEPRFSGISKLVVSFDQPIDPTTAIPANVTFSGCTVGGVGGVPLDLSGSTATVSTAAGDTELIIEFSPRLPNPDFTARYLITLSNVLGADGSAVLGDTDRVAYAVLGDVNGNRRVQANDFTGARSFVGVADPIDPTQIFHVRSDVNNNGRVQANDAFGVRGLVGNDATGITCP